MYWYRTRFCRKTLPAALATFLVSVVLSKSGAAELDVRITPKVSGSDLEPASLRYQTVAGEIFSITRVSYFVSDFALQRNDGTWLEFSNSVAWLDCEQNRDTIHLPDVPAGEFRTVRFLLGLPPRLNHANIAKIPAGHSLNPDVNRLYWGWQGGYIFMALEGLWRNGNGELDGWAFHLARDTNAAQITIPVPLNLTNETTLQLDFDLAAVLNAPRPLSFKADGSSTHSRDGDPIAAALVHNLIGAFNVRHVVQLTDEQIAIEKPKPLFLPAKFTPYPFEISSIFPVPELPRDNPLTVERVELGKKLFFDARISINNRQSCADCHSPAKAFTDGRSIARGAEGALGQRNTMPLFNLAWKSEFFWDGRAKSIREQVLQPIQNPVEMHQSLSNLVTRLASADNYPSLFSAAFGTPEITAEKVSLALENYLLTLTSFGSKFDRVLRGADQFTPQERRGFELFSTEYDPRRGQYGADCFHCHGGPLFQSQAFANNGLDAVFEDPGREKVTGKASDLGKFAVPSLRNVALTGPYMHDGRFRTLDEVVEHYVSGVKRSATLDPNLAKHPDGGLPLTPEDKKALVAFLKTLTDEKYLYDGPARTNVVLLTDSAKAVR